MIKRKFFELLAEKRPDKAEEIQRLARLWTDAQKTKLIMLLACIVAFLLLAFVGVVIAFLSLLGSSGYKAQRFAYRTEHTDEETAQASPANDATYVLNIDCGERPPTHLIIGLTENVPGHSSLTVPGNPQVDQIDGKTTRINGKTTRIEVKPRLVTGGRVKVVVRISSDAICKAPGTQQANSYFEVYAGD
jgi:hypothetical protein